MKVILTLKATVYKTKKNLMESKTAGQPNIEWYQIILDQNDDVCTLTCSKDVYDRVQRGVTYDFSAQYDEDSKKFKVVDVICKADEPQVVDSLSPTVSSDDPKVSKTK